MYINKEFNLSFFNSIFLREEILIQKMTKELMEYFNKTNTNKKVALLPMGFYSSRLIDELIKTGISQKELNEKLYLFDDNISKKSNIDIFPIKKFDECSHDIDMAYVISSFHAKNIAKQIDFKNIKFMLQDIDVNIQDTDQLYVKLDEAINYFSKQSFIYNSLFEDLKNDEFVVYFETDYLYDIRQKVIDLAKNMSRKLIIVNNTQYIKTCEDYIETPLAEVLGFLKEYSTPKSIFIVLNANGHHCLTYILKNIFSKSIVVSHLYDILSYHYDKSVSNYKELAKNQWNTSEISTNAEFDMFDWVTSKKNIDLILYKDLLDDKEFDTSKKLFFPTTLSKNLFQNPLKKEDKEKLNRILFLGAYSSKSHYNEQIFREDYFDFMFDEFLKSGFYLDIFYVKRASLEEAHNEYSDYLLANPNMRIFKGDSLDILLPKLVGVYDWGFIKIKQTKNSVKDSTRKIAFPAKVFSYMSLGIPLIVSSYNEKLAEFVTSNDIGIVIDPEKDGDITEKLALCSKEKHNEMVENILNIREKWTAEENLREFQSVLENIIKTQSAIERSL